MVEEQLAINDVSSFVVIFNFATKGGGICINIADNLSLDPTESYINNGIIAHNRTGDDPSASSYVTGGAGIYATENLTLENCYVSFNIAEVGSYSYNNTLAGASGGGIWMWNADLTLIGTNVTFNSSLDNYRYENYSNYSDPERRSHDLILSEYNGITPDSTYGSNSAWFTFSRGGGICLDYDADLTITGASEISWNATDMIYNVEFASGLAQIVYEAFDGADYYGYSTLYDDSKLEEIIQNMFNIWFNFIILI